MILCYSYFWGNIHKIYDVCLIVLIGYYFVLIWMLLAGTYIELTVV